ncbi:unnamed protein product [Prorocentrum cordatum]|uniref:Uncharacterized protein n=1 Tax=Prorocentrum cordatum TaxID=2364126 RepID=A0ABN9YGU7_9DINO|nr:unnamed protein product [Polarella glacialis]
MWSQGFSTPLAPKGRRCVADASPMRVRCIGDAARSSGPICSDLIQEASRYAGDMAQGSACAVACGAGTVYRNYFAQVTDAGDRALREGQSRLHQVDCLADLLAELGPHGGAAPGVVVQGGRPVADEAGLEAAGGGLAGLGEEGRDRLRARLRVGVQAGVEVTGRSWGSALVGDPGQVVTQVFCTACSVAQSQSPAVLWEPLARLVLEASYEAVLWVALVTAAFHKGAAGSRRLFLTTLGAGATDNDMSWVAEAVRRAMERVCVESGVALDVFVVGTRGGCPRPPAHPLLHELAGRYGRGGARHAARRAAPTFHRLGGGPRGAAAAPATAQLPGGSRLAERRHAAQYFPDV